MLWFYVLLVPLLRACGDVLYASLGDDVTLPCFNSPDAKYLSWYKQVAGEQPQIVSSFYKHSSNIFHKQFKGNKRLSVQTGEGFYNLSISKAQDSDSAAYYCGSTSTSMMTEFDRGLFLLLKNSSCRSFLQQLDSDSVQPGGSVTLNCTVLTGTSDGEHDVYWFKRNPGTSHLGVLYTDRHSSHQCVRGSEGGFANSCVYSLSRRDVSQSDTGTYHCAVASCGHVLFGTGTRLSVEGNQCPPPVLVSVLVTGLVGSLILNVILIAVLYKMSTRKYLQSEGSQQQPEDAADTEDEELGVVQYSALAFKQRPDTSSRQRNAQEETIYSRVRRSQIQ